MQKSRNFDAHFPSSDRANDTFLFFGASSIPVLATEILSVACPDSELIQKATIFEDSLQSQKSSSILDDELSRIVPSLDLVVHLLKTYQSTCLRLWTFQFGEYGQEEINNMIQFMMDGSTDSNTSSSQRIHSNFFISLACATACAHLSQANRDVAIFERSFYKYAKNWSKHILSEATHASLKGLVMMVIYLLFRPQKADIWLLLETACRLAIELGYHREEASPSETFDETLTRSNTFWTIFVLEHAVGHLYGLPSDDLETIITIELPDSIYNKTPSIQKSEDRVISNMARLSLLRSRIFKSMYLPAQPKPITMDWNALQSYLIELDTWHSQASQAVFDFDCLVYKISYHATVLFLFQTPLLHTIADINKEEHKNTLLTVAVPVHVLKSACALIEAYENIILSKNNIDSSRSFPITVISAHEICAGGLMIMAFCICILDGRVKLFNKNFDVEDLSIQHFSHLAEHGSQLKIDLTYIHKVSATCLTLLTWCASQWPGMDGMLEIFKELSTTILPKLAQKQK